MADDVVAIAGTSAAPAAPAVTLIKTFRAIDVNGNVVEIQAVVPTDDLGRQYEPLSENTGRAILEMLRLINNILAQANACGTVVEPGALPSQ